MAATSGPVHYLYLRREGPARHGDPAGWPPAIKQVGSEDAVCVALQLAPGEDGWRVEPLQAIPPVTQIPENTLILTRDSELGLTEGRSTDAAVALLGARVELVAEQQPGRLTHLVVIGHDGPARRVNRPVVVPVAALVVTDYLEHGGQVEAALGLRLTPNELAAQPIWMLDAAIADAAARTLDQVVLATHSRQAITVEVQAGRVSLHGRTDGLRREVTGEQRDEAIRALETTPGVVDVVSHVLVDEALADQVQQALAAKGIEDVQVLGEHGLISLHGEAPDAATRRRAEDIAARVTGVRGVVNRIVVRAPEPARTPGE